MDKYIEYILKENITRINANKFDSLYQHMLDSYSASYISKLTEVLLSSDINPLEYMDYIPKNYLINSKEFSHVEIPNHIREIGESAFSMCKTLQSIELPRDLEHLGNLCLARSGIKKLDCFKCKKDLYFPSGVCINCEQLEYIYLPNNIQITFDERSFQHTPQLKCIIYDGTLENFEVNVIVKEYWRYGAREDDKVIVKCTDGDKYIRN